MAYQITLDDVANRGWDRIEAILIAKGSVIAESTGIQLEHPIPNHTMRKVDGRTWWGKPKGYVVFMQWHVTGGRTMQHVDGSAFDG